jgi:hypothetical protein
MECTDLRENTVDKGAQQPGRFVKCPTGWICGAESVYIRYYQKGRNRHQHISIIAGWARADTGIFGWVEHKVPGWINVVLRRHELLQWQEAIERHTW